MDDVDREFVKMSENLVRSLKHFGSQLEDAVAKGNLSHDAAEKVRANVMEGVSTYMLTTGTLAKVRPASEK